MKGVQFALVSTDISVHWSPVSSTLFEFLSLGVGMVKSGRAVGGTEQGGEEKKERGMGEVM